MFFELNSGDFKTTCVKGSSLSYIQINSLESLVPTRIILIFSISVFVMKRMEILIFSGLKDWFKLYVCSRLFCISFSIKFQTLIDPSRDEVKNIDESIGTMPVILLWWAFWTKCPFKAKSSSVDVLVKERKKVLYL